MITSIFCPTSRKTSEPVDTEIGLLDSSKPGKSPEPVETFRRVRPVKDESTRTACNAEPKVPAPVVPPETKMLALEPARRSPLSATVVKLSPPPRSSVPPSASFTEEMPETEADIPSNRPLLVAKAVADAPNSLAGAKYLPPLSTTLNVDGSKLLTYPMGLGSSGPLSSGSPPTVSDKGPKLINIPGSTMLARLTPPPTETFAASAIDAEPTGIKVVVMAVSPN